MKKMMVKTTRPPSSYGRRSRRPLLPLIQPVSALSATSSKWETEDEARLQTDRSQTKIAQKDVRVWCAKV